MHIRQALLISVTLFIGACSNDSADKSSCGNEVCDAGETPASCTEDCDAATTCGDHVCQSAETNASCPGDCPTTTCGNDLCDPGETSTSCAADCTGTTCGNGACDPGETNASCAADCPATCGNHVCEPTETASSCPADCDPTACLVGPDTCTGDTVCVSGHCAAAFPRDYVVEVRAGVIPATTANGGAWDVGGGLPDPTVSIDIDNGASTIDAPILDNTLAPSWMFQSTPTTIPANAPFSIGVYDSDVGLDDLAWTCDLTSLTADFVRSGIHCAGTGALATGYVDILFSY